MELKRLYQRGADGTLVRDEKDLAKCIGVQVKRMGLKQKFSPDLIAAATAEGWLTMAAGKITIKHTEGEITFDVVRKPGRYCCHCGEKLAGRDIDPGGAMARAHVAAKHSGETSPDPENPSGYMVTAAYKGVQDGEPTIIGKGA